jgi:hypothetical protein
LTGTDSNPLKNATWMPGQWGRGAKIIPVFQMVRLSLPSMTHHHVIIFPYNV